MKKSISFLLITLLWTGCSMIRSQTADNEAIWIKEAGQTLDRWHRAASEADFDTYFELLTADSYFLGTDASENWDNPSFRTFSKPFFDRGKAWSFRSVERHIYPDASGTFAWFDELLETQMGLCRGSGVLRNTGEQWRIAHYVLSIAVPNEQVDALVEMKREHDSLLIRALRRE